MAIMSNLDRDDRDIDERINAPIMVLRSGTPISDISGRDLPSPADIKGENNVLLLPYYQEVEKKEGGGSSMLSLGGPSTTTVGDFATLSSAKTKNNNNNINATTNPHRRSKTSLSSLKEL